MSITFKDWKIDIKENRKSNPEDKERFLKEKLENQDFPTPQTRLYELFLTVFSTMRDDYEETLDSILKDYCKKNTPVSLKSAFAVYMALFHMHRRYRNSRKLEEMKENAQGYLAEHPECTDIHKALFQHLNSTFLKLKGDKEDIKKAISEACYAQSILPKHSGVLHNYAESIVFAIEKDVLDLSEDERAEKLKEAEEAIVRSISLEETSNIDGYPKFYATKGRMEILLKKFDDAEASLRKAIRNENSHSDDYFLRIMEYESHLLRLQRVKDATTLVTSLVKKMMDVKEISERNLVNVQLKMVDRFEKEMKKSSSRNIELLGFFAAVIALIIGNIKIPNQSIDKGGILFTVLGSTAFTGAVIVAFSVFRLITSGTQTRATMSKTALIVGILCIVTSVVSAVYLTLYFT